MVGCGLQDSPEKLEAEAYVWGNSTDANLYGDWDFEVKWLLPLVVYITFLCILASTKMRFA